MPVVNTAGQLTAPGVFICSASREARVFDAGTPVNVTAITSEQIAEDGYFLLIAGGDPRWQAQEQPGVFAYNCMYDGVAPWGEPQCPLAATVAIQPADLAARYDEPALACAKHAQDAIDLNDGENPAARHHAVPL